MVGVSVYADPSGRLRDADREHELVEMALADACGFEYYAPDELSYGGDEGLDWWTVFWSSIGRHYDEADATGQRPLEDFGGGVQS